MDIRFIMFIFMMIIIIIWVPFRHPQPPLPDSHRGLRLPCFWLWTVQTYGLNSSGAGKTKTLVVNKGLMVKPSSPCNIHSYFPAPCKVISSFSPQEAFYPKRSSEGKRVNYLTGVRLSQEQGELGQGKNTLILFNFNYCVLLDVTCVLDVNT